MGHTHSAVCIVCEGAREPLDADGICLPCGLDIDRCDPYGVAASVVDVRAELDGDATIRAAMETAADAAWDAMGLDGWDAEGPALLPTQMGWEGEALGYPNRLTDGPAVGREEGV